MHLVVSQLLALIRDYNAKTFKARLSPANITRIGRVLSSSMRIVVEEKDFEIQHLHMEDL